MARLDLVLLGGFQGRVGASGPLALPTRKTQALLAFLALPPGRAPPRARPAAPPPAGGGGGGGAGGGGARAGPFRGGEAPPPGARRRCWSTATPSPSTRP